MLKIAAWNVNSINVRLEHVLDWLATEQPDVLAIQETKSMDDSFPANEFQQAGYHVVFSGQKTYNGVAIVSKLPATDVITDIPGLDDPQRRILVATVGDVRIINLYVPNGQAVGTDKYAYKLDWLQKVTAFVETQQAIYPNVVVLGDFNIAPDDRDVREPEKWAGEVLCSEPERAALQSLLATGLHDSFRLFDQEEKLFSWWDYRMLAFRRNRGLRIDLILVSDAMRERCTRSWIDKAPRKLDRPSDHAPVIAEFK